MMKKIALIFAVGLIATPVAAQDLARDRGERMVGKAPSTADFVKIVANSVRG